MINEETGKSSDGRYSALRSVGIFRRLRQFIAFGSTSIDFVRFRVGAVASSEVGIEIVLDALRVNGERVIADIVGLSKAGHTRNRQALFALAVAASYGAASETESGSNDDASPRGRLLNAVDDKARDIRTLALRSLPEIATSFPELAVFIDFLKPMRRWGRGVRTGFIAWFESMDGSELAIQAIQYRQYREWAMQDVMRLCHLEKLFAGKSGKREDRRLLYGWIAHELPTMSSIQKTSHDGKSVDREPWRGEREIRWNKKDVTSARREFQVINTFHRIIDAGTNDELISSALKESKGFPPQAIPSHLLRNTSVWSILLGDMDVQQILTNLPRIAASGLLTEDSEELAMIMSKVSDEVLVGNSAIHPITIMRAIRTYEAGVHYSDPNMTWTPIPELIASMREGLIGSLGLMYRTNMRYLIAMECSIDMSRTLVGPLPLVKKKYGGLLTAADVAYVMAMTIKEAERECSVVGLVHGEHGVGVVPMDFTSVPHVGNVFSSRGAAGVIDVASIVRHARVSDISVDVIVVFSCSKTNPAGISDELTAYEKKTGDFVMLVMVDLSSAHPPQFDPDKRVMTISGFNVEAHRAITSFVSGLSY